MSVHNAKFHKRKARVGIRDFRSNLSAYIRRARSGQIIEVTSREEVVAELHPAPTSGKSRRRPGTLKGRIRIAPDFEELPAELIDAFET